VNVPGYHVSPKNASYDLLNKHCLLGIVRTDIEGLHLLLEPAKGSERPAFNRELYQEYGRLRNSPFVVHRIRIVTSNKDVSAWGLAGLAISRTPCPLDRLLRCASRRAFGTRYQSLLEESWSNHCADFRAGLGFCPNRRCFRRFCVLLCRHGIAVGDGYVPFC
jgi:hypothetical protein